MVDRLPTVGSDGGAIEARPVVVFGVDGEPVIAGAAGSPSAENSSFTPLGANETFTGEWVTNDDPQVGYSFEADQDGFLYLDISRNGGTTFSTIKKYEVTGGEVGRFDALVKGAGRSFRLRFVNGPTPQGLFELLAFTGDGLYPFAVSPRDKPVSMVRGEVNITTPDNFIMLVDLSDKDTFPHKDTGGINIFSADLFVAKTSNAVGVLQVGVITRIDATSADLSYIAGVSFSGSSDREIIRDRNEFEDPLRLAVVGGVMPFFSTNFRGLAVTQVNTANTLPSNFGPVTPAVGDIVGRYSVDSGTASTMAINIKYAGSV